MKRTSVCGSSTYRRKCEEELRAAVDTGHGRLVARKAKGGKTLSLHSLFSLVASRFFNSSVSSTASLFLIYSASPLPTSVHLFFRLHAQIADSAALLLFSASISLPLFPQPTPSVQTSPACPTSPSSPPPPVLNKPSFPLPQYLSPSPQTPGSRSFRPPPVPLPSLRKTARASQPRRSSPPSAPRRERRRTTLFLPQRRRAAIRKLRSSTAESGAGGSTSVSRSWRFCC